MRRYGKPEIFNTDPRQPVHLGGLCRRAQGRQGQNLDGRPRPLPRQHLHRAPVALAQARGGLPSRAGLGPRGIIGGWMAFCNDGRPHTALGGRTPAEAHRRLIGVPQNREFPQPRRQRLAASCPGDAACDACCRSPDKANRIPDTTSNPDARHGSPLCRRPPDRGDEDEAHPSEAPPPALATVTRYPAASRTSWHSSCRQSKRLPAPSTYPLPTHNPEDP